MSQAITEEEIVQEAKDCSTICGVWLHTQQVWKNNHDKVSRPDFDTTALGATWTCTGQSNVTVYMRSSYLFMCFLNKQKKWIQETTLDLEVTPTESRDERDMKIIVKMVTNAHSTLKVVEAIHLYWSALRAECIKVIDNHTDAS